MAKPEILPPPPPNFKEELAKQEETIKRELEKKEEKELLSKKKEAQELSIKDKKPGFFGKLFHAKKEQDELAKPTTPIKEEELLDIEEIRSKLNIPSKKEKQQLKEEKTVSKKSNEIEWHKGDVVEEMHKPAKRKTHERWDVEEPKHIKKSKVKQLKPAKKTINWDSEDAVKVSKPSVKTKDSKVKTKKVEVKKPVLKKIKPVKPKEVKLVKPKKRKSKLDKVIEVYFDSVEKEQQLIQKEIENLVSHPKKVLQKTPETYLIHHNEKLIKSLKDLLDAISEIDNEKFTRKVGQNKKAFMDWIKGILEKEKKAESQRNKIFKQKLKETLKEYSKGIKSDISDKKKELDAEKKDTLRKLKEEARAEAKLKNAQRKLKAHEKAVYEREREVKNLIEEGIRSKLDIRYKREQTTLKRATTHAHNLQKTFEMDAQKLTKQKSNFHAAKKEAEELLQEAAKLRKLKTELEKKDEQLKLEITHLEHRDSELKQTTSELEKKDKMLLDKEKMLEVRISKHEAHEAELEAQEKAIKLDLRDLETRKKEMENKAQELLSWEGKAKHEQEELDYIKTGLNTKQRQVEAKLSVAKEVQDNLVQTEQQIQKEKQELESEGFQKYFAKKAETLMNETNMKGTAPEVLEIYEMIDKCKQLINASQIDEAKKSYKNIRDAFTQSTFDETDKVVLHNAIRELYDDINLTLLNY